MRNLDKLKTPQRKYYETHKKQYMECQKRWQDKNRVHYRELVRKRVAKWMKNHPEYIKSYTSKLRLEVLIHYSGDPPHCACCGEDHLIFLCIDHIYGHGNRWRRENKRKGGCWSYSLLKRNNFPEGYQVLCYNCNNAKSHGGCPHSKIKSNKLDFLTGKIV